jgi:hypothetical protein
LARAGYGSVLGREALSGSRFGADSEGTYSLGMKDTVIAIAIVVLVIVGFWWTRGAGGMPGGVEDPAREGLEGIDRLGDRVGVPEEHEDREHEIE